MALKFGLNVKSKPTGSAPGSAPKRKTIFDDDFEDEPDTITQDIDDAEEIGEFDATVASRQRADERPVKALPKKSATKPPSRLSEIRTKSKENDYADLSSDRTSQKHANNAASLDSTIYDYDSFHDAHTAVSEGKKEAARQEAIERKPKYINNLLESAARRKQDQLVAREKLLQKEREAEGEEFADKEKFVTGAYKAQQEEARRIEEEEKKRTEEEERRRKHGGGGMQGFYRTMMDDSEKRHQEAMEAAQHVDTVEGRKLSAEPQRKTDADVAAEMKTKGVNIHINEEGQITDKRQLLSAGLNVGSAGKSSDTRSADHLKTSGKPTQLGYHERNKQNQKATRERQTKMMEDQLAASAKRAADEEAEDQKARERAAKSRKTDTDISSAKERYLARKREAEAAKKGS